MTDLTTPFVSSLIDVFAVMFGCDLSQVVAIHDGHMHSTRDVTGIIGLSGKADGNVVLSIDGELALSLTEAMLGQRPDSIDENVIDAVGETVNIVVGQAKAKFESLALNLGIPTVVAGNGQSIRFTGQSAPDWFSFESPWGAIDMCVGLTLAPSLARERAFASTQ